MGLTNKQKRYIRKHYDHKSLRELAGELNIEHRQVEAFTKTLSQPLSIRKKRVFLTLTLLIPVIFFVTLEGALRFFNYRGDTRLFTYPEEYFEGNYGLANSNFNARFFFHAARLPDFPNDAFLKEKPDHSFRVFVMGGSTTAGYPYGFNATFSRVFADALQDVLPERLVEVVNVGASAINTYTLYDQIPEIIRQNPDAILIYTGHNEFYGALGIGSSETFGAFPGFVRTYLKLQQLKMFMLLRDAIVSGSDWLSRRLYSPSPAEGSAGTLMQRMVHDSSITLCSNTFDMGVHQFEDNLSAILKRFQDHNIPVFISSIASNLKDQPPFASIETGKYPAASDIYQKAKIQYQKGAYEEALELFKYAKDLDALKFRAPEQFNAIIQDLAAKYNAWYVPAYEKLKNKSQNNIIGNEVMLEHLHPNKKGYFFIAKAFFNRFQESPFFPAEADTTLLKKWDLYYDQMKITDFDDRIAYHRVRLLMSGWPFVTDGTQSGYPQEYSAISLADQLAFEVVHHSRRWDKGKFLLADYYLKNREFEKAIKEYEGWMRDQPYNDSPFIYAGRVLLQLMDEFDRAKPYFEKAYQINPSNYASRMLGSIEVHQGNYERGIYLLEKALKLKPDDTQALFNLSGAYALSGNKKKAFEIVLTLEKKAPGFPGLKEWKKQLENQYKMVN